MVEQPQARQSPLQEWLRPKEALEKLQARQPFQSVVQIHAYLDHLLTTLLEAFVPYPEALELGGAPFLRKVRLGVALGLVPKGELAPLESLNKIRNRFAHDLNASLEAKDVLTFYSAVGSGPLNEAIRSREASPEALLSALLLGAGIFAGLFVQRLKAPFHLEPQTHSLLDFGEGAEERPGRARSVALSS